MEWSWLKDWWRLKPKRKHRRSRTVVCAAGESCGGIAGPSAGVVRGDGEENSASGDRNAVGELEFSDAHGCGENGHDGGYGEEEDDDEFICYCDECMNVRLLTVVFLNYNCLLE